MSAKTYLGSDRHGVPADTQLQVAIAAFLWEMANVDGELNREELSEMISAIEHEFQIMGDEASQILSVAEFLMKERKRTDEFLQQLNDRLDSDQRNHLFQILMRVANADGFIDQREEHFANEMKERLNLAA